MLKITNFYPTPEGLAAKMVSKIKGNRSRMKILEPSAGKGDLITALSKGYYDKPGEVYAIEIDPTLQATLRGNRVKVLDNDFLAYTGTDQFDLIIANPPFDEGDKHLMKAIDIMYRGQIIFLLNAETIKNPHTKARKELVKRLDKLGAKIEYIKDAFLVAERKTKVEVALIDIIIDRKVEDDLFAGCKGSADKTAEKIKSKHEVSTGKTVEELVAEYNEVIKIGTETIMAFYRNYNKVGAYLRLNDTNDRSTYYHSSDETLTSKMQGALNELLKSVRTDFWRHTLKLKEVTSRLTAAKQREFEAQLADRCFMDFTESNIRQFVLNLIGSYEQTLIEAVLDIFDKFTRRHSYRGDLWDENIHYYNGWKTNNAYKVNKKVIIPIYGSYGGAFYRDHGTSWAKWDLNHAAASELGDIDKICSYFDGMSGYHEIASALLHSFHLNPLPSARHNNIDSTYFKITVHKKGTIHLTFKNDDILRRFNVVASRGKGWLPEDYGKKKYSHLSIEEKAVVDSFEGEKSYSKFSGKALFHTSAPMIELKEAA